VAAEDFARIGEPDSPAIAALLRCESMEPQLGLRFLDVFASQENLLTRLGDIAVPTLIVHGAHDTVIPVKTAHLLHGSIPDARYHELAGAGHFPSLTHPEQLHEILLAFLAELDRPVGSR
jgi:pimeloyl-ACP methyl ester carboxylesterase